MEMQDFSKSQTKSLHRHRVKSVGPGTKMVFKPDMGLAVSVQARENPTGPLTGVDLKFASCDTKVWLKYRASVLLPYLGISPQIQSGLWNLVYFLVFIVDFLATIVEFECILGIT